MDLTIICLTYNSAEIINDCLNNLNTSNYKVIVIDNCSSDDTLEIVKRNFPDVQTIKNQNNLGYGRANNIALRAVTTKYALIINPDTIISDSTILKFLQEVKKQPKAAISGPLILQKYPQDKNELQEKLLDINKDFTSIKDNYWEKADNDNYFVRFVIGAAALFNIEIMKKIGFFDEKIFMFYEDDEICKRVNDHGYHNMIVTSCIAYHIGGKSSGLINLRAIYRKNWHLKGWSKFYWKELKKGKLRAKRSAIKYFFKYFILILASIIKTNKKSFYENLGAMNGTLAYIIGLNAFKKNNAPRG